jgi:hypothetical protein
MTLSFVNRPHLRWAPKLPSKITLEFPRLHLDDHERQRACAPLGRLLLGASERETRIVPVQLYLRHMGAVGRDAEGFIHHPLRPHVIDRGGPQGYAYCLDDLVGVACTSSLSSSDMQADRTIRFRGASVSCTISPVARCNLCSWRTPEISDPNTAKLLSFEMQLK